MRTRDISPPSRSTVTQPETSNCPVSVISTHIRSTTNWPLQTIETEFAAAGMAENSSNSSSDKSHKAHRANITGITIIGQFFYLHHKATFATRQKDRQIEHKEQINYIRLLNKMIAYLLTWQTGIPAIRFISGQLVPLTDCWLAPGNGYHIVSDACRPYRNVDGFARWTADDLVFQGDLSA